MMKRSTDKRKDENFCHVDLRRNVRNKNNKYHAHGFSNLNSEKRGISLYLDNSIQAPSPKFRDDFNKTLP